jgi:PAS domain S-box-containing protein
MKSVALKYNMLEVLKTLADQFDISVSIADMDNPVRPLIFVNSKFTQTTGYSFEEVLGKNCSFLQGKLVDSKKIEFMRESFKNNLACCVDLVNYKKDGTAFWNRLVLLPFSSKGKNYFLGLQNDITEKKGKEYNEKNLESIQHSEICHKINNPLSIALSLNIAITQSRVHESDRQILKSKIEQAILRIEDFVTNLEDKSEFENWNN